MPTAPDQWSHATAERGQLSRAPTWAHIVALLAGALLFFGVARVYWRDSAGIYSHRLQLEIVFPKGTPGAIEPLVTTGRFEAGDFLTVKYIDRDTAALSYDAWGFGGPTSAPFQLQPGTRHQLEVEMPSLPLFWESSAADNGNLRVYLDGREMVNETVRFHERLQRDIYFAEDPIGGTPARQFRGELYDASGARLSGKVPATAPFQVRAQWIVRCFWPELLIALFASVSLAWLAPRLVSLLPERARRVGSAIAASSAHRTFIVTALVSCLLFTALLTGGTFKLRVEDAFASFYDYQAASLLHGKLDVPEKAIGSEAFVVHHKYYGYFGPTPALLRLPFVIATVGFAKLTRIFLIAYYAASLTATYLLLRQAVRALPGPEAQPSRWSVVIAILTVGIGSTLFFLGSRAYIYHEAALSAAAFALWSTWFALRYLEQPAGRSWIGAVVCGALSIHARPTSGLFALCTIGMVALVLLSRSLPTRKEPEPTTTASRPVSAGKPLAIGILAALAILSFNGMSYLKFRTFDGAPLRYHIQYHAERLANIGGKNFHLSNLRHNVDVYLRLPAFHFEHRFPWFFLGGPLHEYPGAKIDVDEPALGLPFAMPVLCCCCAFIGGVWAAWAGSAARRALFVLVIAALPMSAALCTAIATSHRYTADFCPFLIACAMWGLAAFDTSRWRAALLSALTILLALTIAITPAIALQYQRAGVWGTPDDIRANDDALGRYFDRLFGVQ